MSASRPSTLKVLAANQGLYNGFLAAGLIWRLLAPARCDAARAVLPRLRAGRRGLRRADRQTQAHLFVQALPAAIALRLVACHLTFA